MRDRFFAKTEQGVGGCLNWTAATGKNGYGYFGINRRQMRLAHRVAWFLEHGEWPALLVMHRCDNRRCVNINHLRLGTHKDNSLDMAQKGRSGRKKLTEDQVRELRLRHQAGTSYRALAREYALHRKSVQAVCERKVWQHVE